MGPVLTVPEIEKHLESPNLTMSLLFSTLVAYNIVYVCVSQPGLSAFRTHPPSKRKLCKRNNLPHLLIGNSSITYIR